MGKINDEIIVEKNCFDWIKEQPFAFISVSGKIHHERITPKEVPLSFSLLCSSFKIQANQANYFESGILDHLMGFNKAKTAALTAGNKRK